MPSKGEVRKAHRRAYYARHREAILEKHKAIYEAKKPQRIAQIKAWRGANRDRTRAYKKNRRSRLALISLEAWKEAHPPKPKPGLKGYTGKLTKERGFGT